MTRILGWLVYQRPTVCFACAKITETPCPGHEYGGTIVGYRVRWLFRRLPTWTSSWVPHRWSKP